MEKKWKTQNIILPYDKAAAKIIAFTYLLINFNIVIQYIFPSSSVIVKYRLIFIGMLYIVVFLWWGKLILFKTGVSLLLLEGIVVLLVAFSVLNNYAVLFPIINRCLWTVVFGIPNAVLIFYIEDENVVIEELLSMSWPVLGFVLVLYLVGQGQYNMTFGYMLLSVICLHVHLARRRKMMWLVICLEYIILLSYGSRGALISSVPFIFLYGFTGITNRKKNKRLVVMIAGGMIALLLAFPALQFVAQVSAEWGISSRTLRLLLRGELFSHDSGRGAIYSMIIGKILEKPLIGWGVAGECSFMKSYPHNLFLEIFLHYGIPLGSILNGVILWALIRFLRMKDMSVYALYCFCIGVVPLMVSGTYLQKPEFFVFISLSLLNIKKGKKRYA